MLIYTLERIDDVKVETRYNPEDPVVSEEVFSYRLQLKGDTYPVKEQLKKLGYKWDGEYWAKELVYTPYNITEEQAKEYVLQLIENADKEIALLEAFDEVQESKFAKLSKIKKSMNVKDASNLEFFDYKEIKTRKQLNQKTRELHEKIKLDYPLVDAEWIQDKDNPDYKKQREQHKEYENACRPIEEEYDIIWDNFDKFKKGLLQK